MPNVSHATGRTSEPPTFAQFRELFAQSESGRMTKGKLQQVLRGFGPTGDWFPFTSTHANLHVLFAADRDLFKNHDELWWSDESFSQKVGGQGLKFDLRTSAIPGSFNRHWSDQGRFITSGEFIPSTRTLVQGMIDFYNVTGIRLFSTYWVWTDDVTSEGYRVRVQFSEDGLMIGYGEVGPDWYADVGFTVIRKSQLEDLKE